MSMLTEFSHISFHLSGILFICHRIEGIAIIHAKERVSAGKSSCSFSARIVPWLGLVLFGDIC